MKSVILILIFCSAVNAQGIIEYSAYSDIIPVSVADKYTADSVFAFIKQLNGIIDFEDCNICKSRAHIIAGAVEKQFPRVTAGKVWLIADCKRVTKSADYKYKPLILLRGKGLCINWIYHVAPVIITRLDTFVIDPATQTGAVSPGEWAAGIITEGGKALIIVKDKRFFIYPDDKNNNFIDDKPEWRDDNKSLLDEHYSRSIDEMVRASLGIIEPWKMNARVKKIKEVIY